jgi:outer membrane protein assembly factor BamB
VLAPPLQTRWTSAVGGHIVTASPIVADGRVYVATTDLADGDRGTIVALDLVTGATVWTVHTDVPMRGGPAFVPARDGRGGTLVVARIDGAVLAFDAATGRAVWREELSTGLPAEAGAVFGTPASDDGDVIIGHQRKLAVLDGQTGMPEWTIDPVPEGRNSQSLAAVAIGDGAVIGTFNRAFGGVGAWDRATGSRLWRVEGDSLVAINASPVIDERGGSVFVVTGMDEVLALALSDGELRWHHGLDAAGFHWGNATIGTPAMAHGVLVVPTLYRDLVALDATDGVELWRATASAPSALRATHYRGAGEAGFAASPVITGDVVWSVDTAGDLAARELSTGKLLWRTALGVPVLAGLAASGDWLIVASYDGTVRALVTSSVSQFPVASNSDSRCEEIPEPAGCCDARAPSDAHQLGSVALLVLIVAFVWTRRGANRPARVT